MGYNDEHASMRPQRFLCFDLETARRDDVGHLLPPVEAAKNLKDPEKIEADLARKRLEQTDGLSLDVNGCRIVALGCYTDADTEPEVFVLRDVAEEKAALEMFWRTTRGRKLIGFRSRTFDLPVLFQRSRLLGAKGPTEWRPFIAPYGRGRDCVDLYDELTFDGLRQEQSIRRSLDTFAALFGLDVPSDDVRGEDIAGLVQRDDYDGVCLHCRRDVERTVGLARLLGVIPQAQTALVF